MKHENLSADAQNEIREIEKQMQENDRENERLRQRISAVIDADSPPA